MTDLIKPSYLRASFVTVECSVHVHPEQSNEVCCSYVMNKWLLATKSLGVMALPPPGQCRWASDALPPDTLLL